MPPGGTASATPQKGESLPAALTTSLNMVCAADGGALPVINGHRAGQEADSPGHDGRGHAGPRQAAAAALDAAAHDVASVGHHVRLQVSRHGFME